MGLAVKGHGERRWRPQLTQEEKRVGWAFFVLYLFAFPFLVGGVVRILDERWNLLLTPAQSNAIYYGVILGLLVTVFWDFLRNSVRIWLDYTRENLFALCVGLAAGFALTVLAGAVPLGVDNPVRTDYKGQFLLSPAATVAVVMFLRPMVEEILYRGLLFGSLRKRSRTAAYAVSAGVFALASVWQFAFPGGEARSLLLAVQYLPLGLAQCWCYDVGGSVFTPMALRVILSGVFLILALVAG